MGSGAFEFQYRIILRTRWNASLPNQFAVAFGRHFLCPWLMRHLTVLTFLTLLALHPLSGLAHPPAQEMAAAATNFLSALTPEQQAKARFKWDDTERFNWHFVPKPRKGLPFKEMTATQHALAEAFLKSGLSPGGFAKADTIISLERILAELEANKGPQRDTGLYFVSIFGQPGKGDWAWRVEGHHLSLNFAIQGDRVSAATPSFFGANPAQVQDGPRKGLRALPKEEDLARELVKSLDAAQRAAAVIATNAPKDIITGNARQANSLEPLGLSSARLKPPQRKVLQALLKEYLFRYRNEIAEPELKRLQQAGDDQLHFAWAGGLEPGEGHYYRLQGPGFLIEYDNTQNNANHVHTVWRDLKHDFGSDPLRAHYEQVPHGK